VRETDILFFPPEGRPQKTILMVCLSCSINYGKMSFAEDIISDVTRGGKIAKGHSRESRKLTNLWEFQESFSQTNRSENVLNGEHKPFAPLEHRFLKFVLL
jgi:hypothetical protein